MPMRFRRQSSATMRYGNSLVRSSSSATGATSPSANSRTVRRIRAWSGERSNCMTSGGAVGAGELHEQAHAVAGGALAHVGAAEIPGRAGDVQVRPGGLADEVGAT